MSGGKNNNLNRLAEAITDEIAVDWATETQDHPELANLLPNLRLLSRIGEVFQDPFAESAESAAAHDSWGPLLIHEKLGEGSYGTVFRAHDPHLRRDVALKLLRSDLAGCGPHANRFLAEARLMARVQHRNVLVIHGAAEHDGRIGFWTDLLKGETLEEMVAGGGVMGAGEAALCGRELCRALGAVHGAGLVHGDVKAANVMREEDGRIVLMDFGAGSEYLAGREGEGPLSGTPLALAPELLAGGAPNPATDIYALGVLLYRLVAGRYPFQAESLADLRRMQSEGEHTPLLDLRPDLGNGFVQAIQRAIEPDPDRRFKSAGELEGALAAILQDDGEPGQAGDFSGRRFRSGWLAVIGLAVLIAAAVLAGRGLDRGSPTGELAGGVPLTASASFLRTGGDVRETLADGALVRPGDTLSLTLQLGAAAYVYVLNEGRQGEVYVLFPLAETDLRNPLPRGRPLRLPGTWQNTELDWQVTEGRGEERFLVVAAREPISWLEDQLADFDSPARNPTSRRLLFDSFSPQPERGVGAVAGNPGSGRETKSVLDNLASRLATENSDHSDIWYYQLMLYNLGR